MANKTIIKVCDLKVGDKLFIPNQYTDEINEREVWQIFQDKDYMYIIDEHKTLYFAKNDSTTLYSRETSNIYLNKNEVFDLRISNLEKRIEEQKESKKRIIQKYKDDIESVDFYIKRKTNELLQLKTATK